MMHARPHTPLRGYTLLELIVAVGIFSLIMLAATGAYLTLIKLDQQARAVNDVANNLSFAVDSMSRTIRTGTDYDCEPGQAGQNCAITAGNSFGFRDTESPSRYIEYALSQGQIVASLCSPAPCSPSGAPIPLTDPRIMVSSLEFRVRGVGTGDGIQPQVTFTLKGTMTAGSNNASTTFIIQSGATRRLLEL